MTRATAALAAGLGVGAGLMYFLDPDRGSRRRTHARNQLIHASHRLQDTARGVRRVVHALERHPEPRRMIGVRDHRLASVADRGANRGRVAAALAGVAGLGLVARAAMHARSHEIELRS